MSQETKSTARDSTGRFVLIAATFGLLALVFLLKGAGSITVLGMSLPAGVIAVAGYLLGVAAGWGAMRKQR